MRGNIQVAAKQDIVVRCVILVKILSETIYPIELELILRSLCSRSVRDVGVDDPDAVYRPGDQPLLSTGSVVGKVFLHVADRIAGENSDAVVCPFAEKCH